MLSSKLAEPPALLPSVLLQRRRAADRLELRGQASRPHLTVASPAAHSQVHPAAHGGLQVRMRHDRRNSKFCLNSSFSVGNNWERRAWVLLASAIHPGAFRIAFACHS